MTQRNVERLIGRLLTDETLCRQFLGDPNQAVAGFVSEGWELTETEQSALANLDHESLAQLAGRVDRRIRKASLTEDAGKETSS